MRNTPPTASENQSSKFSLLRHLSDYVLNAPLPKRTWSKFFSEPSRKTGLASAMLGAGLGASGFVSLEVTGSSAQAGIINGEQYDAARKADGANFSAANGGNVVSFFAGDMRSSGILLDAWTVGFSRHQLEVPNVEFKIGTKLNFLDETQDSLFTFSSIITHPDSVIDFAIAKLKTRVPGITAVTFADILPAQNTPVWLAGYGTTGDITRGYVGQDGNIRAGMSIVRDSAPLLGLPAEFYHNTSMVRSDPLGLRGAGGDSGGGVFTTDGKLLGIMVAAPGPVTGTTTTILELSNPYVKSFAISNMGSTAVPEPSSLSLLGVAVSAAFALRKFLLRCRDNSYAS